jgi:hypothetical protein
MTPTVGYIIFELEIDGVPMVTKSLERSNIVDKNAILMQMRAAGRRQKAAWAVWITVPSKMNKKS